MRRLSSGYYQIIAGERRWRAAKLAGLAEVPAVIIEADDRKVMELGLIENLQREDLNPAEEARGYQVLMEEYGLTQEQVAERMGKSRPAIANTLRLLALPEDLLKLVEEEQLSAGHARAPCWAPPRRSSSGRPPRRSLPTGSPSARRRHWSRPSSGKKKAPPKQAGDSLALYLGEAEKNLSGRLGRKVHIAHRGKKAGSSWNTTTARIWSFCWRLWSGRTPGRCRAMADPQTQNAPQAGGPPKEERPGQQWRRRQSVVLYITILFAAAFALLLMTYAMDQRRSNETLGDLTSSVSDLKDSLSGMQTAQSALEENGALKNEIQDLQEQIDTLLGTIDSLTAAGEQQGQVLERTKEAMDYFWQIDEAYVRGRYSLCRDLIAVLEDTSSGEAP